MSKSVRVYKRPKQEISLPEGDFKIQFANPKFFMAAKNSVDYVYTTVQSIEDAYKKLGIENLYSAPETTEEVEVAESVDDSSEETEEVVADTTEDISDESEEKAEGDVQPELYSVKDFQKLSASDAKSEVERLTGALPETKKEAEKAYEAYLSTTL